jgi:hypothetical protein
VECEVERHVSGAAIPAVLVYGGVQGAAVEVVGQSDPDATDVIDLIGIAKVGDDDDPPDEQNAGGGE